MTFDHEYFGEGGPIVGETEPEPDGIIRMQALEYALDFTRGRGGTSIDADDMIRIATKFYDFITGAS